MNIVFDLDGTLANIEHRLSHIRSKPKNWQKFFAACVDDKPIGKLIEIAQALFINGHRVEIWSGRSDEVREQTVQWLAKHGVLCHDVRMRTAGDYRQDAIVKGEWFDALPEKARPEIAFDDRQQVVDMWRSRGVLCCQVAPGDF